MFALARACSRLLGSRVKALIRMRLARCVALRNEAPVARSARYCSPSGKLARSLVRCNLSQQKQRQKQRRKQSRKRRQQQSRKRRRRRRSFWSRHLNALERGQQCALEESRRCGRLAQARPPKVSGVVVSARLLACFGDANRRRRRRRKEALTLARELVAAFPLCALGGQPGAFVALASVTKAPSVQPAGRAEGHRVAPDRQRQEEPLWPPLAESNRRRLAVVLGLLCQFADLPTCQSAN